MGKATTIIGLGIFMSMLFLGVAIYLQSVDPTNPLLASQALFGSGNMVYSEVDTTGDTWMFGENYASGTYLPNRETTGEASATSTQFPDWTYSGLNWFTSVGSMFLNVIGMPYTISVFMFPDSDYSAVIGAGFSMLYLFIIVLLILGKID